MDNNGQPYIEWEQTQIPGRGIKRAWIQRKTDPVTDWAKTGRYLNVARCESFGTGPKGNATDFPISSNLSDEDVLRAFVAAVCGIVGCPLPNP